MLPDFQRVADLISEMRIDIDVNDLHCSASFDEFKHLVRKITNDAIEQTVFTDKYE
jgi:hypothetical protein